MTRKFHKTFKALPSLWYMKNKALSAYLDANKALGFVSCFTSILAMHLMLYFSYRTSGIVQNFGKWGKS